MRPSPVESPHAALRGVALLVKLIDQIRDLAEQVVVSDPYVWIIELPRGQVVRGHVRAWLQARGDPADVPRSPSRSTTPAPDSPNRQALASKTSPGRPSLGPFRSSEGDRLIRHGDGDLGAYAAEHRPAKRCGSLFADDVPTLIALSLRPTV